MGWLSDIGNAVSSAASAVGDTVENVVDAVVDTVEDAVDTVVDTVQDGIGAGTEWLCKNGGGVLCGIGNVVGGAIDGFLEGAQGILHDSFDIVRDLGNIVGSILRFDLPGLLKDLGELVLDIVDLAVDIGRQGTGGFVVGGIVKHFKRSQLMSFVDQLVQNKFDEDPNVLRTVRQNIGLEGRRFGFRLPAEHRVFVMDSDTVPLWRMHNDGIIDLYAMAGMLSFGSFALGDAHPNTVFKSVGSDGSDNWWAINRWSISHYIASNGTDRRLRVYAMSHRIVARLLDTASRKHDEVGVILEWNDGENYSWFRDYTRQPITESEYDFNSNNVEILLAQPEYNRPVGINCNLVALGAFKLDRYGRVGGRDIADCEDFPDDCATQGRTDRCCNTINRSESSGVIHRNAYPTDIFQYVLAHEIGHYLGLCHCGHDGPQNVMFSNVENSFWDWGMLSFYWEDEPHFSLEDGRNAWRFIVDQMEPCITGSPEKPITIRAAFEKQSTLDSCAVIREKVKEPTKNIADVEV